MLYHAVLSVPIDVFIRRWHDSVLPRNHKSNFLKKQEAKEPGRHTLEKPGIPKPQKPQSRTGKQKNQTRTKIQKNSPSIVNIKALENTFEQMAMDPGMFVKCDGI